MSRPELSNFIRSLNIVRELAIGDFRMKYHDSFLGYLWSMLNPMFMFAVYYFVFTKIFTNPIPDYPLFLLSGIISYGFFQECTFSGMSTISSKAGIIKKIYFPRTLLVFASTLTAALSYFINLIILTLLTAGLKGLTPLAFLVPIPILCLIMFSMGVSFILATLYSFFRDMGQIWNVAVLVIFWVSPIVFNVETLPQSISSLVYFNPLTRIFVLMRHYLLYNYFDLRFLLMTVVYSLVTLLVGFKIFTRYQNRIPELF